MIEHFALAELHWQAWKNGAGRTREIAVSPPGAGLDDFDWRISVAEVAGSAPFSIYPGVDRCISLLRGAGLHLRSDDAGVRHRLDCPLASWRFDGGTELSAELLDGPCLDFNVMTRRGRWQSEVLCLDAPFRLASADAVLLLCVDAAPSIGGRALRPDEGALWRHAPANVEIGGVGRALAVRLLQRPA